MTALTLAWRYLRGRGLRSLLTTLAVALGVMLVFGLNGILPTIMDTFSRSMLTASGKVDLTVASTLHEPFDPVAVEKTGRVPGVAVASGVVEQAAPLPVDRARPASEQLASITVVGIDPATAGRLREYPLAAGRLLTAADADTAVVASDVAGRLGLRLGDELALPSQVGTTRVTVVGLLSTPTVGGQERVYLPLTSAQRLLGLGDRVTAVEAALAPGADRAAVEDAVRAALGPDFTIGGLSSMGALLASLQMSQFAFTLFGVFAMATAGFIILNSFRTMVAERRRDIGMLRAIGTPRRVIGRMFLAEALLQGVLGTALGLLLGYGLARGLFAVMGPMLDRVMHLTLGPVRFEPSAYALAIALGLGVTAVAALVPARAAGRVSPLEALRPESEAGYRRTASTRAWIGVGLGIAALFCLVTRVPGLIGLGAVLFLIALALVTPVLVAPLASGLGRLVEEAFPREGALARSNLQRNPGRSAVTVSAVMLGLASIVAMVSVVQAIFAGFLGYIDRSMASDYLVVPQSIVLSQGNVAAGPALADEVRHTAGVGTVSTLRVGRGTLNGADVQVIGLDPATYLSVATLDWNDGSSDAAIAQLGQGRWLVANGIFAGQAGLVQGQAVTLDTPSGTRTYHVAGVGNDYLNAKVATVYLSQDALARDFHVTSDLMVLADRTPSADPAAVQAALTKVVDDYPGFRLYEASTWKAEQQTTFNSTLVIFDALIAALAIPSLLALLNTLSMSVLARTREIGMLRGVGATRRQVRRMVLAESLLLSLIGTLFGVVSGLWLGYALVEAMKGVGWPMPYRFPWSGVALTVAAGLGFGALAALLPARSASRLDVVEALHHA